MYYVAYGSNLNINQMAHRCPDAKIVGTAEIKDYRLKFKGSMTGSYLTIEKEKGCSVPVAVWDVSEADIASLDRYEGFPTFYYKKRMILPCSDGKRHRCFVYIMHEERRLGIPYKWYVEGCAEGYRTFGFDEQILADAVMYSIERCDCRRYAV